MYYMIYRSILIIPIHRQVYSYLLSKILTRDPVVQYLVIPYLVQVREVGGAIDVKKWHLL